MTETSLPPGAYPGTEYLESWPEGVYPTPASETGIPEVGRDRSCLVIIATKPRHDPAE